jgi:ethanolamine ammonia-lyase large subunit
MYCKADPRVSEFYQRRHVLSVATSELKSHGEEKGLATKTLAAVNRQMIKVNAIVNSEKTESTLEKENKIVGNGKKRHSADRDLAIAGLVLSPRKRRKLY